MLSSLRPTVLRSLSLHSRSIASTQLGANQAVIDEVLNTFGSPAATPEQPTPTPTTESRLSNPTELPPTKDPLLEFLASLFMERGHRARAEKSASEVLLHINALTKAPPLPILRQAVELAAPAVRVMRHKTGGKVVVKPVALNERQRTKKAIDWIIEASKSRVGYTRGERVARECIRIIQGTSSVLEKKEGEHKLAMVNRWVVVYVTCVPSSLNVVLQRKSTAGEITGRRSILILMFSLFNARCQLIFLAMNLVTLNDTSPLRRCFVCHS